MLPLVAFTAFEAGISVLLAIIGLVVGYFLRVWQREKNLKTSRELAEKMSWKTVAEKYFERAVELEPKSEPALDCLLEAAIINKNKSLALKALNTLMGISSDAMKLQSYQDKIDIL